MVQLLIRTIGFRKAEEALSLGTLFSPEKALEVGLVDQLVSRDMVLDRSYEVASKFAKIPSQARYASKMLTRRKHLDHFVKNREWDANYICSLILSEPVQKGLGAYLANLSKQSSTSKQSGKAETIKVAAS